MSDEDDDLLTFRELSKMAEDYGPVGSKKSEAATKSAILKALDDGGIQVGALLRIASAVEGLLEKLNETENDPRAIGMIAMTGGCTSSTRIWDRPEYENLSCEADCALDSLNITTVDDLTWAFYRLVKEKCPTEVLREIAGFAASCKFPMQVYGKPVLPEDVELSIEELVDGVRRSSPTTQEEHGTNEQT